MAVIKISDFRKSDGCVFYFEVDTFDTFQNERLKASYKSKQDSWEMKPFQFFMNIH